MHASVPPDVSAGHIRPAPAAVVGSLSQSEKQPLVLALTKTWLGHQMTTDRAGGVTPAIALAIASRCNVHRLDQARARDQLTYQLVLFIIGCVADTMDPVPLCTVCMERFGSATEDHRPHSLPCGHSLCYRCLGKFVYADVRA